MLTKYSFSRAEYLEGRCTHREYYGQFVTEEVKREVARSIGIDKLKASRDQHFNDVPLSHWDNLSHSNKSLLSIPENGTRFYSLCGGVCILKEAARQLVEAA